MLRPHLLVCVCLFAIAAHGSQEQSTQACIHDDGTTSKHQNSQDIGFPESRPAFMMKKLLQGQSLMANIRNSASGRRKLLQVNRRSSMGLLRRRQLLQDYSPVANEQSPPSNNGRRRLLQDYSPVANDRSPPDNGRRRLLQDYSPAANDRSPSNNRRRRLLQDYSPVANDHSPINNRRKLLQDYSPVANDRTPINNKRRLL